jgi:predicted aldo/keto reductase-like oxidoreductase
VSASSAKREADMGGTGDSHEISWGDVTDVVQASVKESFDRTVQESLAKLEMDQVDESTMSIKDLDEYKECVEIAEELGKKIAELMKKAHDEGLIAKMGQRGV